MIKELKGDPTLSAIAGCIESADLWLPGTGKREARQHPGGTETKNPLDEWKTKCPSVTSDDTKEAPAAAPSLFPQGIRCDFGPAQEAARRLVATEGGDKLKTECPRKPLRLPPSLPRVHKGLGAASSAVQRGRLPLSLPRLHTGFGAASGAVQRGRLPPSPHVPTRDSVRRRVRPSQTELQKTFGPEAKGPS